jgi:hypothetical protein
MSLRVIFRCQGRPTDKASEAGKPRISRAEDALKRPRTPSEPVFPGLIDPS